jgi:hypothetical protein
MSELAASLHQTGKAHAGAACLLYSAARDYAKDPEGIEQIEDQITYAFNGPYSLSLHYLLGLGIELMLKAVIVALDSGVDAKYLQNEIGHDLIKGLDEAEHRGFVSEAQHLRDIVELLRDPYKLHWFRYERPSEMPLPGSFDQVIDMLTAFEGEVAALAEPN